ncbi:MAG: hypothetical protein WCX23_02685 [Candidatus Paceibacterota bacterium]|jgi:hypothetical protein
MKSKNKIALSALLIAVSVAGIAFAAPCAEHTLLGFGWSENVGTVSFSCKSCDADDNGYIDSGACGGDNASTVADDYGVDIASDGKISGYAWNDNIGTISFNIAETNIPPSDYPCSDDNACIARLQGNKIAGWARALSACDAIPCAGSGAGSNSGGWDGWIKFDVSGAETQISEAKIAAGPYAGRYSLTGWANSSEDAAGDAGVIGSISMSNTNMGGAEEYQLTSLIGPNHLPTADFECDNSSCRGVNDSYALPADPCACYTEDGCILHLNNLSSDPDDVRDGLGNLISSNIIISNWYKAADDGSGFSVDPTYSFANDGAGNPAGLPMRESPGVYKVKLIVADTMGEESSPKIINGITFLKGLKADFDCSKDGIDWSDPCASLSVEEGKELWLRDNSSPSEGASIDSWTWKDKNGTVFGDISMVTTTASMSTNEITLEVSDDAGHWDDETKSLKVIPLPRWRELLPF